MSRTTREELHAISLLQVTQGFELSRARRLAAADAERQRALEPLLTRAAVLEASDDATRRGILEHDAAAIVAHRTASTHEGKSLELRTRAKLESAQQTAVQDDMTAVHLHYDSLIAEITNGDPRSPPSQPPRTSSPPAVFIAPPAAAPTSHAAHDPAPTDTDDRAAAMPPRSAQPRTSDTAHHAAAPETAPPAASSKKPLPPVPTFAEAAAASPADEEKWTRVNYGKDHRSTPRDPYLGLRISKLKFHNPSFPLGLRAPIKDLATTVNNALYDPANKKPILKDALRQATKDDLPFFRQDHKGHPASL